MSVFSVFNESLWSSANSQRFKFKVSFGDIVLYKYNISCFSVAMELGLTDAAEAAQMSTELQRLQQLRDRQVSWLPAVSRLNVVIS